MKIIHINDRISKIKEGNLEERDRLIQDYIPFIIKTISNCLNKYFETENCDEFIVGLEAFNESIDKYDILRGNFFSFSSIVIKNRIIDYIRKEKLNLKSLSLNELQDNHSDINYVNEISKYNEDMATHMELSDFKNKLSEFNITLDDLVENSPKHSDTRLRAINIARHVQENIKLKNELYKNKKLPYSEIIFECDTSRKFLDRNKRFIIATILILDSNLDILKTYVYGAERRLSYDI